MITLPKEYEERMKALLGEEFEAYKEAVNGQPVKGFRVNTDKISLSGFEKINPFGSEKIPYTSCGFYLELEKAGNHPFHHAGMIYIQEPGAMMPAECVDIKEGWTVLDMCAAPGGKSTQLKNKIGREAVLVSNEIIPSRCKILTGNIERMGFHNTVTTCMDSGRLASTFPETFDLVMVDTPCSGEGMFRKEDAAVSEWSEENVRKCSERSIEILENAARCVKKSGYIIYATCTFSLEENEKTVDAFLQRHPEFEIVPATKRVRENTCDGIFFPGCKCENISYARRFYPHKSRGEGQFAAVLKNKLEPASERKTKPQKKDKVDSTVFDFLDDTLMAYEKEKVMMYNSKPVYFTEDFPVAKGLAFSCGITVGEIRKNYIIPHHQFFMAMGNAFKRKIELSAEGEDIIKYLHGEEIGADCANGWAVVTVNGCAVGGAKVSGGRAKNHYPKGLRIKF